MSGVTPFWKENAEANEALLAGGWRSVLLAPSAADPAAAPVPIPAETRSRSGEEEQHRLDVSETYTLLRFRSAPFASTMSGLDTSVAFFLTDHFVAEGDALAAFGPQIFAGEHTKAAFLGGGPKYVESAGRREIWVHALVGDMHIQPQTANGGRNGLGFRIGGGMDYQWPRDSRLWLRGGADFVRSQLYSTGQNSFAISVGVVFRVRER
jgi:hypothetical protein